MWMRLICGLLAAVSAILPAISVAAEFRVGAAVVDVSPTQFPVLINGSFLPRQAERINTPVSARAIVVDDGLERLAIVVVDSCMMPRDVLDDAKRLAAKRTEIAFDRMLISATHTHSAPSCMRALGTNADSAYVSLLREGLANAIAQAEARLEPARIGFGKCEVADMTAVRRWIRRSDRTADDPFGNPTVHANMHAAQQPEDVTGPAGPEDPELTMVAFQSPEGRPIAVLANYSMHYFGDAAISADYFGLFCNELRDRLVADKAVGQSDAPVVAMSHGCSGDIWLRDYSLPVEQRAKWTIDQYASLLVDRALEAYQGIDFSHADPQPSIAMAEQRMTLSYRVPDAQRLQWAQQIVAGLNDGQPTNQVEVYAVEQLALHELQQTEIVIQAVRLGDIAIATTPNETYALTGWKLKLQSPLEKTMVIELANGGDGYIPPPEQHLLGGYNTWPARSAGLEVQAEPKIVAAALSLLEQVAEQPRQRFDLPLDPGAAAILKEQPAAFWRMNEWGGAQAFDSVSQTSQAVYEPGVVFFLEGAPLQETASARSINRAPHFAGGRLITQLPDVGQDFTVVLWCWNGMPAAARPTNGWLVSRDHPDGLTAGGQHFGIGGTASAPGCLIYQQGVDGPVHAGKTPLERYQWNRVTLVRDGDFVRVFLNGFEKPELEIKQPIDHRSPCSTWFFGGRSDRSDGFEGRLDEIAVFPRPLRPFAMPSLAMPTGKQVNLLRSK